MAKELRVALLGQGFMGKAHSNAWCQVGRFFDLPMRARRVLICGRNTESLDAMARRWEWEETSTDWRAAIDRPDIDAVDICLPNHLHAPAAIAAAAAGKIILCEKPLAMSLAEAEAMTKAARGRPTLVWFNYRRVPAIALARRLVEDGRVGTAYHYRATYLQQWGNDPARPHTWKMDPETAGSGVAGDLMSHSIDTAMLLNGPIRRVSALSRIFHPGRQVQDAVLAMAEFANGSIGSLEATRFGIGMRNANRFELHGSGGMLRFDLERFNHLEFFDARQPSTEQGLRELLVTDTQHPYGTAFWKPGHVIGYEHTFIATLGDFLACLDRGEEFHPNFADALEVQRVLEAVEESARTGEWRAV